MGAPAKPPANPCSEILPFLEEHGVSWADFTKRMTRDPHIKRVRVAIVTELHRSGCSWDEMTRITSFGAGQLAKYTKAVGCAAARKNKSENARKVGHSRKGESKPWLSEQMKAKWGAGGFDFHKGRVRSEEERATLKASWTPERRTTASDVRKALWENPSYREPLEAYHRNPKERARRSREQTRRMLQNPEKWSHGRGQQVAGTKCVNKGPCFWVRSRHEVAAVTVLENDPSVDRYEYEPRFILPDGKWVLPDFKVFAADGSWKIIEVKAAWVFNLPPEHRKTIKINTYRSLAKCENVSIEFWTETDVLHDHL